MNPLQITQKQQKMLLEMVKELFPEYESIKIGNFADEFDRDYESANTVSFLKNSNEKINFWSRDNLFQIHWFEFCMTYLVCKLDSIYSEKYIKSAENKAYKENNYPKELPENWIEIVNNRPFKKLYSLLNGGSYKKHPIDYLYEQFKKLK